MSAYRKTAWVSTSVLFALLLLCLGGVLLASLRVAHAQDGGALPPADAPAAAKVLRLGDFPTVTLEYPCIEPAARVSVLENGRLVAVEDQDAQMTAPPARVAVFLDAFRRSGRTELPPGIAAGVSSASRVVAQLESLPAFAPPAHKIEVFVPSAAAGVATSVLSPTWTSPASELAGALVGEYEPTPTPVFQAQITRTTALYQMLAGLIETELPASAGERQVMLVYSDGSDELSPRSTFTNLVNLAVTRAISINTVFIPTIDRPDAAPDPRLQSLALATGGKFITDAADYAGIAAVLTPVLEKRFVCRVTYQAETNPPTIIDVKAREGGRPRTIATAALPPNLRLAPPQLVLALPEGTSNVTATAAASLPVTISWQLGDDRWRWAESLAVVLEASTLAASELITQVFTDTAPIGANIVISLAELPEDVYRVQAAITDNFGLMAVDAQYIRINAAPTATPTPAPQTIWSRTTGAATTLLGWLTADPLPRFVLLYGVGLLMGLLILAAWIWLQQQRREQPQIPAGNQPAVSGPPFAVLIRERRGDSELRTLHMVQLFSNSGPVKLPEYFLEAMQQRYGQAEIDSFCSNYSAYITCGATTAEIYRDSALVAYSPITIRVAQSVTPFELAQGRERAYELQDGDIVLIDDIGYRYTLLRKPERQPAGDSARETAASASDAQANGGVHVTGAPANGAVPSGVQTAETAQEGMGQP